MINTFRRSHLYPLCFMLCFILFSITLWASNEKIYDKASLFSESEKASLAEQINSISSTYGIDAGIVTTNSLDGQSIEDYSDNFWKINGYSQKGVLLVIDMESRKVSISSYGDSRNYFTNSHCSNIREYITPYLSSGNYYTASTRFLTQVAKTMQHELRIYTPMQIMMRVGIAALVAFLISLIVFFGVGYRYKHPKHTVVPASPDNNSIHYTAKRDQFLTTFTTRTRIESDHSSGSGGSGGGHTGSSGSF